MLWFSAESAIPFSLLQGSVGRTFQNSLAYTPWAGGRCFSLGRTIHGKMGKYGVAGGRRGR